MCNQNGLPLFETHRFKHWGKNESRKTSRLEVGKRPRFPQMLKIYSPPEKNQSFPADEGDSGPVGVNTSAAPEQLKNELEIVATNMFTH